MVFVEAKRKKDKKKNKNSKSFQEPLVDFEAPAEPAEPAPSTTKSLTLDATDEDINGSELGDYARRRGLKKSDVWAKIQKGELVARTENGFIYVYGEDGPDQPIRKPDNDTDLAALKRENLPPLPVQTGRYESDETLPAVSEQVPEVALLLEHLAMARNENREIMRLSQDSIARITKMSDSVISSKDDLIAEKDALLASRVDQIAALEEKLKAEQAKSAKLNQEIEDLEMLAKSLVTE